jgi:hypothetical protein
LNVDAGPSRDGPHSGGGVWCVVVFNTKCNRPDRCDA